MCVLLHVGVANKICYIYVRIFDTILNQLIDHSDTESSYFMVAAILSHVRARARKHTHTHKQANANTEEDRNVCGQPVFGWTYSAHVCTSLTVSCTHAHMAAIRSNHPHVRTAPGPLIAAVSLPLVPSVVPCSTAHSLTC